MWRKDLLPCLFAALSATAVYAQNVTELPLTDVVLYSSGVGSFVHQGRIEKDSSIRFRMTKEQLNDLLKSLYVTAAGEGIGIKSVTYPTEMPLNTLLEGYRINVAGITSLSDILRQLRGADFEGATVSGSAFQGKLVTVETREIIRLEGRKSTLEKVDYAVLLTEKGIQRIPVAELASIVPSDKALLAEMTKALTILAEQQDKSMRPIDVNLAVKKPADVRVAYVIESPVWKASYRLELGEKAGDKAHLQGWALVENPTGTEWKNVRLSLISGRPESFIQDLYTSLYLSRPHVERESYESMTPVRHEIAARSKMRHGRNSGQRNAGVECMAMEDSVCFSNAAPDFARVGGETETKHGAMGELYCYRIANPVTLGSRQSAMLELISTEIPADKISYYSMSAKGQRPFNSVMLKNSSSILLPQGPVTVFDGKNYGGDASLSDLAAGQEQILSYGMDLEVVAQPCGVRSEAGQITNLVMADGRISYSVIQTVTYQCSFTNNSKKEKTILFEVPREAGQKIVNKITPFSETADTYRFLLPVKAGETSDAVVKYEKTLKKFMKISVDTDFTGFAFAGTNAKLSAESKAVVEKLLKHSRNLKELRKDLKIIETAIADLSAKHDRTRSTLNSNIAQDLRNRLNQRIAETDEALDKQYQLKDAKLAEIRKAEKEFSAFLNLTLQEADGKDQ